MKRYLGARGNTDRKEKAASHSRQNHATPLPHCTARTPWCLQPPFIPGPKQTHKKKTHTKCTCVCHMRENVPAGAFALDKILKIRIQDVNKHLMLHLHLKDRSEPPITLTDQSQNNTLQKHL